MRVLALGGTGGVGKATARKLAADDVVSEITIASRRRDAAEGFAAELGKKAMALALDATDERGVAALAQDHDLVVNTAGPDYKVALPAVRAAIAAGTHYCDIQADGPAMERALKLDAAAKVKKVTALMGIGHIPGISNLMMLHAAHQFDRVEEVACCGFIPLLAWEDPKKVLARIRETGFVSASWQTIMQWVAGKVRSHRNGRPARVDPWADGVEIRTPQGKSVRAVHVGSTEPITLPRVLRGAKGVSILVSVSPPQLNELLCEQGRRIAQGHVDSEKATLAFHETIVAEPDRWLSVPEGTPSEFLTWATATGRKDGRRGRYTCWPASDWMTTSGPLATAALKILRGEIRKRGVLSPESCLDPLPFLAEAARSGAQPPRNGKLFNEFTEGLD